MTQRTRTLWLSLLSAVLSLSATFALAQAKSATLTLKIDGLKGTDGVALVALYDSADTWLKVPKAAQVVRSAIRSDSLTVDLKDVKPGTYAISVFHDANKNNELDMRWLPYPKPKEGSGTSRNAPAKSGPPKWEDAKFEVSGEPQTMNISIVYP